MSKENSRVFPGAGFSSVRNRSSGFLSFFRKYKTYIISIAIALAASILGGIVTYLGMGEFNTLNQPPLSPPGFLFPVVWTVLYVLMGIGAARIYNKEEIKLSPALVIYGIQLFFNYFWSVFFFGAGLYLFSFIWLIALWALVLSMIILFYRIDKPAAYMQIPYILWLSFAAYLNFGIYLLN